MSKSKRENRQVYGEKNYIRNRENGMYKCLVCEYQSIRLYNVTRHEDRIHKKQRFYSCCENLYMTKGEFYLHVEQKHPKSRVSKSTSREKYKIDNSMQMIGSLSESSTRSSSSHIISSNSCPMLLRSSNKKRALMQKLKDLHPLYKTEYEMLEKTPSEDIPLGFFTPNSFINQRSKQISPMDETRSSSSESTSSIESCRSSGSSGSSRNSRSSEDNECSGNCESSRNSEGSRTNEEHRCSGISRISESSEEVKHLREGCNCIINFTMDIKCDKSISNIVKPELPLKKLLLQRFYSTDKESTRRQIEEKGTYYGDTSDHKCLGGDQDEQINAHTSTKEFNDENTSCMKRSNLRDIPVNIDIGVRHKYFGRTLEIINNDNKENIPKGSFSSPIRTFSDIPYFVTKIHRDYLSSIDFNKL